MRYKHYPSDPALTRSGFRCTYCGADLLRDLEAFLSITRDHLVPRSAGGADGGRNRVVCCATCDHLKAASIVTDVDEARELVARERTYRQVWFERVREAVRG